MYSTGQVGFRSLSQSFNDDNFSHFSGATVSVKISNFRICFRSFDLFCPIFEQNNFIKHLYIVLSYLIAIFLKLVCFALMMIARLFMGGECRR